MSDPIVDLNELFVCRISFVAKCQLLRPFLQILTDLVNAFFLNKFLTVFGGKKSKIKML